MEQQKYLFYCGEPNSMNYSSISLDNDYTLKIWRPKIYEITPKGLFTPAFFTWGVLHILGLFHCPEYRVFLIYYKNKKIANYTVVQPKYFRSAFMDKDNLQIGPVGTAEDHRRKGLAFYTIQKILEFYRDQNRKFWYVARKENEPSLQLVEKVGFRKYGEGIKRKKFIGGILDTYIIEKTF